MERVDRVVSILKPFYDATIEVSFDDACVSLIIPIMVMVSPKMESAPWRSWSAVDESSIEKLSEATIRLLLEIDKCDCSHTIRSKVQGFVLQ